MFNAQQFMNTVYEEANSTRIAPLPPGEYVGFIEPITGESFSGGISEKNGRPWARLNLMIDVSGEAVKAATGQDRRRVRAGIMLQLDENGNLDMREGRNIQLGRLREAVGLNVPGKPFKFSDLEGRLVKIVVDHRVSQDDPSVVYEEVTRFMPANS